LRKTISELETTFATQDVCNPVSFILKESNMLLEVLVEPVIELVIEAVDLFQAPERLVELVFN